MNQFDMINPSSDHIVYPYLHTMGFDLEFPVQYSVSQHRNLQNKVVIGYVIRGEVRCDREFLTSEWADVTDRMVAADYQDVSLCKELISQQNTSLNYDCFHSNKEELGGVPEPFPLELTNPNEKELLAQIRQLEGILVMVRGDAYDEAGNPKMSEYQKG